MRNNSILSKSFTLFASVLCLSSAVRATDWPEYRGAAGDGISTENLTLDFSAKKPKVLWKVPTNTGFSSFSVAGGKCFTQVVREIDGKPREVCLALDAATGKELWVADVAVGKGYKGGDTPDKKGDGPRSTPTVSGSSVYVLTPDLVLHALAAADGKSIWSVDLIKDFGGKNIQWNSAASPVADGELVFVMAGGEGQSLLAFNKETGKVAWKGQSETITHATPVVATIQGERQVIFFCKSGLVSVAAKDGALLWKFPFEFKTSTAASPVVSGDIVYCSAGYGVGGGACKISKSGSSFTAKQLWQIPGNTQVANHWSTPVAKGGYLYGMFGFKEFKTEPLKCVEAATGKVMWSQPGFGQGNVILAGDKLLALSESGDIVVAEPNPQAYKEVSRVKALSGKCWSTPAVSNGQIFVRSTVEGVCLQAGK